MAVIFSISIIAFGVTVGTHWKETVALVKGERLMKNYAEKTFESDENKTFNKIDISLCASAIDIVLGDKLSLKTYTNDSLNISSSFDNDTFSVNIRQQYDFFHWFSFADIYKDRSCLTIPNDFVGTLILKNQNGEVLMNTSGINLQKLDIDTSNGKVEVNNATLSEQSTFSTSNGAVNINNISSSESLFVKTSNAPLTATNVTSSKDINLKTSNEKLTFNNIKCNELFAKTSNSKINGNNVDIANGLIETSNGAIDITVPSSFLIEYTTSNGSANCNNANLGKNGTHGDASNNRKIFVKTSNADIDIHTHCN